MSRGLHSGHGGRMGSPWWMARVTTLLAPMGVELGPLWRLSEQLLFIRENVEPALLTLDFLAHPTARALWALFVERERAVGLALRTSSAQLAGQIRRLEVPKRTFRLGWERLGYLTPAGESGTPADDYLDGLMHIARYTDTEPGPPGASPNMSSRAERIADFLGLLEPGEEDVVFDLGSGSGKVALTVSASSASRVVGIECSVASVERARASADALALSNVRFEHCDVRESDLSSGTIFYLYYPFHGAVAQAVTQTLGALARTRDITIYAAGPKLGFGEHFLTQVTQGALRLEAPRGEFGEAMVLRSGR